MLQKDRADRIALEWRMPGKTFEKHDSGGVQVGRFGHFVVQRAGLLGRAVAGHFHRLLVDEGIALRDPRHVAADKHCAGLDLVIQDNVVGTHVAVYDAGRVHLLQRGKHTAAHRERVGERKRSMSEPFLQALAGIIWANQLQAIVRPAEVKQRAGPSARQFAERRGFVVQSHSRAGRDEPGGDALDHYVAARLQIVRAKCLA